MVMSLIVGDNGKVCIAHDMYYDGTPLCVTYTPEKKSLTLTLDNGRQEHIGSAALPEISRSLHRSREVTLMQIDGLRAPVPVNIPLHIHMAE